MLSFLTVIKHHGKGKKIDDIIMSKPTTDLMYQYVEAAGELENLSPAHPLNTEAYKKKQMNMDDVTCYAFFMDERRKLMFSGYGDGLICIWQFESL